MEYFRKACGCARFAYNWALARWNSLYAAGEKTDILKINAELNAIKRQQFPWMYDVTKCAVQQAVLNVGDAFRAYFDKRAQCPCFKKKGSARDSFYLANDKLSIKGKMIRISKLGWVHMRQEVRFPGRVLSVTICRDAADWYASVLVDVDPYWVYPHRCENQAVTGVDLGIKTTAVLADGTQFVAPKELARLDRRLRREQRSMCRKQKGSVNRDKARRLVARTYQQIRHVRSDFTHKMTTSIVKNHRVIGIEDLNVVGMRRNHRLAKSISERCFGEIRRQLEYKANFAGSKIVVVDRWYPSSKTCSTCGHVLDVLPLGVHAWTCPACGAVHDRDQNAAINLRDVAVRHTETENACGEAVRPTVRRASGRRKASSVNQESHRNVDQHQCGQATLVFG